MFNRVCAVATCVAVVLISTMWVPVDGRPILGPDFNTCKPVIPKFKGVDGTIQSIDCCMLTEGKKIKDFKFNLDLPIRVRRPAHRLDEENIRKYERAMALMRALPPEDPRSHLAQANIHCAYCEDTYGHFNSTSTVKFDVHHCWLFLPFHRWYLYFHERILASLIGDDTLAVPYWAWDVQNDPQANVMPAPYVRKNTSLYNELQDPNHQPPMRANLMHDTSDDVTGDELFDGNSFIMWQMMIGDVKTSEAFYGEKYAEGDPKFIGEAVLETSAHAAIHGWVGHPDVGKLDMNPGYSAAREPMFFAHHAQMDRLWEMWKNWGGKDLQDPDWLDAQFVFYDEHGDLVRVNVRDSLNLDNFRPEQYGGKVSFGGVKRAVVTSRVSVPGLIKSSSDASSVYDDVLVIAGVVEKPFDADVQFHIFLELPEADETTPRNCVEFLGTVRVDGSSDETHPTISKKFRRTTGIGERLRILNVVRQKSVTITFVPVWDQKDVSVRVTDLTLERKLAR
ncbi:unnamed protein product [Calypogeia fissa]